MNSVLLWPLCQIRPCLKVWVKSSTVMMNDEEWNSVRILLDPLCLFFPLFSSFFLHPQWKRYHSVGEQGGQHQCLLCVGSFCFLVPFFLFKTHSCCPSLCFLPSKHHTCLCIKMHSSQEYRDGERLQDVELCTGDGCVSTPESVVITHWGHPASPSSSDSTGICRGQMT